MLLLRIVVPGDLAGTVLAYLDGHEGVASLIHFPSASRRPAGDLIHCVVVPELASVVVSALTDLGVPAAGSITMDRQDATVSQGSGEILPTGAAVVWEELESRIAGMAQLSIGYLLYMMAATIIAAIGILTDSVVLIIGAMVVGPEFGPLSGLSVGLIQRRPELIRQSAISLAVGFTLAFAAAFAAAWVFRAADLAPATLASAGHPSTLFISHPDAYTVVVAAICGVVGMLSLTTASAGTLVGVLISVTTIPAAGNVGVAAAYGNLDEVRGALIQLAVNLVVIQLAGLITLRIQRAAFAARVAGAVARVREVRLSRLIGR